jgi:hypothetical protein
MYVCMYVCMESGTSPGVYTCSADGQFPSAHEPKPRRSASAKADSDSPSLQ